MASRGLDEDPAGAQRTAVLVIAAITSVLTANLSNYLFIFEKSQRVGGEMEGCPASYHQGAASPA